MNDISYYVTTYYDSCFRGCEDACAICNESTLIDYIWEKAQKGFFITIETPTWYIDLSPDKVIELGDNGELAINDIINISEKL